MGPKDLCCPDDGKLSQQQLEDQIKVMIESFLKKGRLTYREMPVGHLVRVLHRAADMLDGEPMLLELESPPEGIFITGDVLGSMGDLIQSMNVGGFPPHRTFLFLGNYIEGDKSIECLVLLLLLKLRWPHRIYVLRGERETDEAIMKYCFNKLCQKSFREKELYQKFSFVFDRMPVAAIIDDAILCCRGGVSQWMTSRDSINRLPKPTSGNLNIMERCILTDILFSQPTFCEKCGPFEPSMCEVGYSYNKPGFEAVLKALKVERLVRAGYVKGVTRDFDGRCFTVRARGRDGVFRGAVLKVKRNPENEKEHIFKAFTYRSIDQDHVTTRMALRGLKSILLRNFETTHYTLPDDFPYPCKHCEAKGAEQRGNGFIISHGQVADWMTEKAKNLIEDDAVLSVIGQRPPNTRILLVELFPLCYDSLNLEGSTYRIALTDGERSYLAKKGKVKKAEVKVVDYPHSSDPEDRLRARQFVESVRDVIPTAKEIAEVEEELESGGIIEVVREENMAPTNADVVEKVCALSKPKESSRPLRESLRSLVDNLWRRSEKSTKEQRRVSTKQRLSQVEKKRITSRKEKENKESKGAADRRGTVEKTQQRSPATPPVPSTPVG